MNVSTNPKQAFNLSYEDVKISGPFGSTLHGWYLEKCSNIVGLLMIQNHQTKL